MQTTATTDLPALRDPDDRSLLTYHDDATGERTDLSAAELGGWVARTVSLLRDGCGLRPGDRVLVDTTEHEHPVTWLLAPLAVGASVVLCANPDPGRTASRVAAEKITRVL